MTETAKIGHLSGVGPFVTNRSTKSDRKPSLRLVRAWLFPRRRTHVSSCGPHIHVGCSAFHLQRSQVKIQINVMSIFWQSLRPVAGWSVSRPGWSYSGFYTWADHPKQRVCGKRETLSPRGRLVVRLEVGTVLYHLVRSNRCRRCIGQRYILSNLKRRPPYQFYHHPPQV